MPGTQATTQEQVGVDTDEISPSQQHRVVMPSSRHSVLAKAARYRSEPERVKILSDEPLLAVVHGLHAEHTVTDHGDRIVCSCERFQRGEGACAHVLAVEERRSRSTDSTDLVAVGQAVSRALHSGPPTSNATGLFGRVLVPVWDVSATHSIAWISALTRAAGGELVLLGVVPRARGLLALADMAEALERLAASDAADGTSVRATVLSYPAWPDLEMAASATLVVLPLPALDDTLEPTWYELIEHLVASSRLPLLVIPHASHAATGEFSRCILAAIDGSPASAKVLDATAALAHATNARVVVLQVGTDAPRHLANQHVGAPFGAQPAGARAWADRAARSLRQPAVNAVGRAVLGDAAAAIPAVAEDTNARVIVLGTSPQTGKKRWLGSTSSAVLRQTQRPVLLVRPDGVIARSNPATTSLSEVDSGTLPSPSRARSRDIHTPSPANTDGLDTVS